MSKFCLAFALLFCGCGNKTSPPKETSYPISVTNVVQKDVPIYIEAIGNVNTLQFVQIRPQVGGIILKSFVKQGDYVKKGDPLYLIDPRPYQAALDKAKATLIKDKSTLQFSENQVQRYSEVVKKDYVAKLTYDQFVTQVDFNKGQILSDEADIVLAELNLEWTQPTSPIDGKISQYNIDPGNLVVANDPNFLTDVRQLNPADVHFNINQNDFIKVQKAQKEGHLKFHVILPQDKQNPREGTIFFIDNHVDTSTGTILFRGAVPNEDEFLWPGEFVQVRLQLSMQPNALLIPAEAVKIGQDGNFVYIYHPDTSRTEYRPVVKGETIDNLVLIEKGIDPKEQVVLKGQINLRPNSKVYIADSEPIPEKKTP